MSQMNSMKTPSFSRPAPTSPISRQRRHLVAEVRQVAKPFRVARLELAVAGGAVHAGGSDSEVAKLLAEPVAAFLLDREGDLQHRIDRIQAFDLLHIRLAHESRILCPGAFRIDKGAFEVDAGKFAPLAVVGGNRFQRGREVGFRQGQGGRQQGGHAFGEFFAGDGVHAVDQRVAEVEVVPAVAVDIHKARHRRQSGGVDGPVGGGQGRSGKNSGDFSGFDQDGSIGEIEVRGDQTAVFDQSFHGNGSLYHDRVSFIWKNIYRSGFFPNEVINNKYGLFGKTDSITRISGCGEGEGGLY